MSKILELADAYARETHPALITEARAALAAEVSKLEQEHIQRLLRIEKEVDVLIAERDALRAENERLTQQAFTLAVECDELRMELGDLPESQAEMLTTIKELHAENDQIRTLMSIYNLGCWRDSLTLIKERDALRTELEAVRKDAARYRWLRDEAFNSFIADHMTIYPRNTLDATVDAAIGATK